MVQFSSMAWHSGIRKGAQFASRTVRRFVRFFFHPIWCYSPSQILKAVQRDWEGPVFTGARTILGQMSNQGTSVMVFTFSEKDEPFLELECTARLPKPTPGFRRRPTRAKDEALKRANTIASRRVVGRSLQPFVGHPPARPERNDMDKLERDTEPNNGWTIKFATLKALREQAQEMGENPTEEEVEAVALAMVNLGYALIEMPNPSRQTSAAERPV